MIRFSFTF